MGYVTDFYGTIRLKSKFAAKLLQYLKKQSADDLNLSCGEVTITDDEVELSGNWKNSEDAIQKICQLVASLDPEAEGEIQCWGEEKDDLWRVVVGNGIAEVQQGQVDYASDGDTYESDEISKIAEELKNNQKLKEKILAEVI